MILNLNLDKRNVISLVTYVKFAYKMSVSFRFLGFTIDPFRPNVPIILHVFFILLHCVETIEIICIGN